MCLQSKETIIEWDELPKFNGYSIQSIYAEYENSRYDKTGYIADILFYKVYLKKSWKQEKSMLKVKELPADFQKFFGIVENKGRKVFVKNMSFRESGSGNGSFTDESLDISGWASNATNSSFSLYRGCSHFMDKPDYQYVIDVNSELGQDILNVLNKEYEVKEIEFAELEYKMKEGSLDFASKYPYKHTPIQIIDGMVYPDEKLPSWRWLHGMSYRQPDGQTNRKYIRVWDGDLKQHVYLERVDDLQVGDENLLFVDFHYKQHDIYGSEGNAYCRIGRYIKEHNHQYATHTITKMDNQHWNVEYNMYRNGNELISKGKRTFEGMFYRIVNIRASETHKDIDKESYN